MGKKILIIAGEASGDLHGANLVEAMQEQNANLDFFGIGGDRMQAVRVRLIYHSSQVAFLGLVEVIEHLPFIRQMMRDMVKAVKEEKPNLVILIDYPGFNLRFAERIKKSGLKIPIFYYISPQVWAWHKSRVPKIARLVDRMAVIFPFEVDIYREVGLDTHFVGHPFMEILKIEKDRSAFCRAYNFNPDHLILGLLPGSRRQEIQRLFPAMLNSVVALKEKIPELQIAIGLASTLPSGLLQTYLDSYGLSVTCVAGQTYDLINAADLMLVKSGSSTLETGIIGKPMIIIYKVNWLSYFLARMLIRIPNIGLVNVVAGKRVVPELIQHDVSPKKIVPLAYDLLTHPEKRTAIEQELEVVRAKLGTPGASDRAARLALELLN